MVNRKRKNAHLHFSRVENPPFVSMLSAFGVKRERDAIA